MKRRRLIGILGGTFNPIHVGHLLIAQDAMEQMRLERVKFIPSATPPHKAVDKLAGERDRMRLIRGPLGAHRFYFRLPRAPGCRRAQGCRPNVDSLF